MGVSGQMFLPVPVHPGSPGQRAIKQLCVCYVMHFVDDITINQAKLMWLQVRCLLKVTQKRQNGKGRVWCLQPPRYTGESMCVHHSLNINYLLATVEVDIVHLDSLAIHSLCIPAHPSLVTSNNFNHIHSGKRQKSQIHQLSALALHAYQTQNFSKLLFIKFIHNLCQLWNIHTL